MTRLDNNTKNVSDASLNILYLTRDYHSNTFNISNGSNNMVSTSLSPSVSTEISVGDFVTLKNVQKQIVGTANITSSSNVITGLGTNFINDLVDGQTIYISTGNTSVVKSIVNANTIFVQSVLNVTSVGATINVVFDETRNVTFVNTNTALVDTNFTSTNNFVSVIVQKVR